LIRRRQYRRLSTNSCDDTETNSCPPPTKFEIGKPLLLIRERQIAKVLKRESREAVCKKVATSGAVAPIKRWWEKGTGRAQEQPEMTSRANLSYER